MMFPISYLVYSVNYYTCLLITQLVCSEKYRVYLLITRDNKLSRSAITSILFSQQAKIAKLPSQLRISYRPGELALKMCNFLLHVKDKLPVIASHC